MNAPERPESPRESPAPGDTGRPLTSSEPLTGTRGDPDPREPLGRTFHEHGRLTVNAEREKPFAVTSWEDRTDEQREIDMRGASAVAVRAVHDAGIDLAARDMEILRLRAELARLRSVLLEGGQDAGTARRRALAVLGAAEADIP